MKDEALERLPEQESTQPEGGRKPKLVLLFGDNHSTGLENNFNAMQLHATFNSLDTSTPQERAREQFYHIIAQHKKAATAQDA